MVGLGNPGKEYEKTRHNVGFMVLDRLVSEWNVEWSFNKKSRSEWVKYKDLVLLKPMDFMNNSGFGVAQMVRFDEGIDKIVLVHDELDLDLGVIKVQKGRGHAGHNGVRSVMDHVGKIWDWDAVVRVRMGIGKPEFGEVNDWVLGRFFKGELELVDEMIEEACELLVGKNIS